MFMPSQAERQVLQRRLLFGAVAAMLAASYGLTLWIFYPGVMTWDAKFVYEDIAKGTLGDWQSPVMTLLWGLIDTIAPGPGSMFLLIATSYWLGFGLLSFVLATRARRAALLLPILSLMPPAFAFVGIIWRDVLFATCWLLAAGVAFAVSERPLPIRMPAQMLALALVAMASCCGRTPCSPLQFSPPMPPGRPDSLSAGPPSCLSRRQSASLLSCSLSIMAR
jgi:hypothetical protein